MLVRIHIAATKEINRRSTYKTSDIVLRVKVKFTANPSALLKPNASADIVLPRAIAISEGSNATAVVTLPEALTMVGVRTSDTVVGFGPRSAVRALSLPLAPATL